jgi:hypothetical protein
VKCRWIVASRLRGGGGTPNLELNFELAIQPGARLEMGGAAKAEGRDQTVDAALTLHVDMLKRLPITLLSITCLRKIFLVKFLREQLRLTSQMTRGSENG